MSLLAQFRWWRKLRGGHWSSDCVTGKNWERMPGTAGFEEYDWKGFIAGSEQRVIKLEADLLEQKKRTDRAETSEKDFYRQIQELTAQLSDQNLQMKNLNMKYLAAVDRAVFAEPFIKKAKAFEDHIQLQNKKLIELQSPKKKPASKHTRRKKK